ncbi:hypothetical protein [Effusibacillus consociatus]|uniref:DUF4044 domain-containing protein n=1 Tax=Effusibacillus consociatus TaxID=1117041 RepID=A0ABV9PXN6_9BACL
MMIRTLFRHIRKRLKNIDRNGWMTFVAVGAIVISLIMILGVFLTMAMKLQ